MKRRANYYSALCTIAGLTVLLGGARDCAGESHTEPLVCPALYAPVCGADGTTYGNECELDAAGIAKASDGECVPVETSCRVDSDCSAGEFCDFPVYAAGAPTDPEACPPPPSEGVCHPIDLPVECSSDADCASYEFCNFYEIAIACDCLPDTDCVCPEPPPPHGTCEPRAEPAPECTSDADCSPEQICVRPEYDCFCTFEGGVPCDCPPIGPGFCAVRPVDPPPPADTCLTDSDCDAGQRCVFLAHTLPAEEPDGAGDDPAPADAGVPGLGGEVGLCEWLPD